MRSSIWSLALVWIVGCAGGGADKATDDGSTDHVAQDTDDTQVQDTDVASDTDDTDGGVLGAVNVSARVTDSHGEALAGAQVRLPDGTNLVTDAHGRVNGVAHVASPFRARVEATGFATDTRLLTVDGGEASAQVALLPATTTSVSPGRSSTTTASGVVLALDGQFLDAQGAAVAGPVDMVVATATTPEDLRALPAGAPGSFALVGADVSFSQGGAGVTLDGTARIQWPLPARVTAADLDGAKLTSFDESTGLWVENGSFHVEGGMVIAVVDHFTRWTVRQDVPTTCLYVSAKLDVGGSTVDLDHPLSLTAMPTSGIGATSVTLPASQFSGAGYTCVEVAADTAYTLIAESWHLSGGAASDVSASVTGVINAPATCGGSCAQIDLRLAAADADGDGYAAGFGADCDDANDAVHPGAADVLDAASLDSNCDGVDGVDADGDGVVSLASGGTDCNDSRADVFPGRPDVGILGAGDVGIDNDCDGSVDEDGDADGDGQVSAAFGGPDCNDHLASVHAGATDTAGDGVDQDCDGTDAGAAGIFVDADGDGFPEATDCNDHDNRAFPGAVEVCDWHGGREPTPDSDQDCDHLPDNLDPDVMGQIVTRYEDRDGDGYGSLVATPSCPSMPGFVATSGDCVDTRSSVNPGAVERCNEADDDCDGTVDLGADGADLCADGGLFDDVYTGTYLLDVFAPDRTPVAQCGGAISLSVRDGHTPEIAAESSANCSVLLQAVHVQFLSGGVGPDGLAFGGVTVGVGPLFVDGDWHGTIDDVGNFDVRSDEIEVVGGFGTYIGRMSWHAVSTGFTWDDDYDGFTSDVDCDDADPATGPGRVEVCDVGASAGVDEDCDGLINESDDDIVDCAAGAPPATYTGTAHYFLDDGRGHTSACDADVTAALDSRGRVTLSGGAPFAPCTMAFGGTSYDLEVDEGAGTNLRPGGALYFNGTIYSPFSLPNLVYPAASGGGLSGDHARLVLFAVAKPNTAQSLVGWRLELDLDRDIMPDPRADDADFDGTISALDCDDADPTRQTNVDWHEYCSGVDDDCNGLVDEMDPALAAGECATGGTVLTPGTLLLGVTVFLDDGLTSDTCTMNAAAVTLAADHTTSAMSGSCHFPTIGENYSVTAFTIDTPVTGSAMTGTITLTNFPAFGTAPQGTFSWAGGAVSSGSRFQAIATGGTSGTTNVRIVLSGEIH